MSNRHVTHDGDWGAWGCCHSGAHALCNVCVSLLMETHRLFIYYWFQHDIFCIILAAVITWAFNEANNISDLILIEGFVCVCVFQKMLLPWRNCCWSTRTKKCPWAKAHQSSMRLHTLSHCLVIGLIVWGCTVSSGCQDIHFQMRLLYTYSEVRKSSEQHTLDHVLSPAEVWYLAVTHVLVSKWPMNSHSCNSCLLRLSLTGHLKAGHHTFCVCVEIWLKLVMIKIAVFRR